MTLAEFLLARIAEDEAVARAVKDGDIVRLIDMGYGSDGSDLIAAGQLRCGRPARALAECEAKRRIVELHKNWPVLVETPPTFAPASADDVGSMTVRMSQQIAWATEQQYREHFGTEPPTGPILRALAAVYADHEDFQEEWRG